MKEMLYEATVEQCLLERRKLSYCTSWKSYPICSQCTLLQPLKISENQKTLRNSDVFRGLRKCALGTNGLILLGSDKINEKEEH